MTKNRLLGFFASRLSNTVPPNDRHMIIFYLNIKTLFYIPNSQT